MTSATRISLIAPYFWWLRLSEHLSFHWFATQIIEAWIFNFLILKLVDHIFSRALQTINFPIQTCPRVLYVHSLRHVMPLYLQQPVNLLSGPKIWLLLTPKTALCISLEGLCDHMSKQWKLVSFQLFMLSQIHIIISIRWTVPKVHNYYGSADLLMQRNILS